MSLVLRASRESGVVPYIYIAVVGCLPLLAFLALGAVPGLSHRCSFRLVDWRRAGLWLGSAVSQRCPGGLSAIAGVAAATSARPFDRQWVNGGGRRNVDAAPLKNTVRTVRDMVNFSKRYII